MNICVCGYYGMGNFGDELFLETLKQVFYNHNVFAWQSSLDPDKIDVVIVGGGDIITPYSFNQYYFPEVLKNHPTWVYGVGVVRHYAEETWPQEEVCKNRERLKSAIRLVVRDPKSQEVASRLGFHENVEFLPDMVFSYKQSNIYPINRARYKKLLGVCVYSYNSYPLETMASLLVHYANQGFQIMLIPMVNQNNAYSDMPTCRLLRDKIEEKIGRNRVLLLAPQYDLELIHSWIHSLDYFISSKLHPSLVALMGGVPVLTLTDQGKVSALMEQYGLSEYALSIHTPENEIREKLDQFLIEGPDKVKEALPFIEETIIKSDDSLNQLKEEIEEYMKSM